MNKSLRKDIIFYVFAVLLTVLLYRRDVGGVVISKYIFLGIAVFYAVIADYNHLLMATAFMLPLACGLPGNYIFPLLCVLMLVKGRKRLHISRLVWVAFIFVAVSEFFHILLLSDYFQIPNYLGYCAAIFLLFVIGGADLDSSDNAKNALAFCIGSTVMLTVILLNFSLITGEDIMDMNVRIGDTSDFVDSGELSLGTNSNNMGLYSIATIAIAFALWQYKRIPVWVMGIMAILAFLAGVDSFSRTWMVSLLLFGILFVVANRGNTEKRGLLSVIVILASVVGVYLFFTRYSGTALDMFSDRFSGAQIESAGARTTLFADYNRWMFSNPGYLVIGTGAALYKDITMLSNSTHNALQQIIVCYGIPGFIFFLYLLYRSLKKWHVAKERMVYVPMIIIGLFLQSVQFLNPHYCMYPFIASFFILKMVKNDDVNKSSFQNNNIIEK